MFDSAETAIWLTGYRYIHVIMVPILKIILNVGTVGRRILIWIFKSLAQIEKAIAKGETVKHNTFAATRISGPYKIQNLNFHTVLGFKCFFSLIEKM